MRDYSQTGEQAHILKAVEGIERGRLLDIGSWDPEDKSNSRALIEMGWEAVLFEPSPGPLRDLLRFYKPIWERVYIVSNPVTVQGGMVRMHVTDDAVSTAHSANLEQWRETGGFYGVMNALSISIRDLFEHFGGDFQFVNFDVEGTSVDLFAEMCRVGPRPRCVCIEHDARHVELAGIAEAANYATVHLNGNNAVLRWNG